MFDSRGLKRVGSVNPSGYPCCVVRNVARVGSVWLSTALMTCGPLIGSRLPPPARWKWMNDEPKPPRTTVDGVSEYANPRRGPRLLRSGEIVERSSTEPSVAEIITRF